MPKDQTSSARAKLAARIGAHDWGRSGYDTFGYDSLFFRQWIATQLPAKHATILSVGCGSGEVEAHLSALGHAVIGLDHSRTMLKRASRQGLERLVAADARVLPFAPAQFDVVLMLEAIGYLALDEVFAEARRVLRRRGRLLATSYGARVDADRRYRKWRMDEITQPLAAAGFRIAMRRALDVKKKSVRDAPSEARANLLYVSATAAEPMAARVSRGDKP